MNMETNIETNLESKDEPCSFYIKRTFDTIYDNRQRSFNCYNDNSNCYF